MLYFSRCDCPYYLRPREGDLQPSESARRQEGVPVRAVQVVLLLPTAAKEEPAWSSLRRLLLPVL